MPTWDEEFMEFAIRLLSIQDAQDHHRIERDNPRAYVIRHFGKGSMYNPECSVLSKTKETNGNLWLGLNDFVCLLFLIISSSELIKNVRLFPMIQEIKSNGVQARCRTEMYTTFSA